MTSQGGCSAPSDGMEYPQFVTIAIPLETIPMTVYNASKGVRPKPSILDWHKLLSLVQSIKWTEQLHLIQPGDMQIHQGGIKV